MFKEKGKPDGTRPKNRTGFLGLIGANVDTIDCTEKINDLIPKLEAEQRVVLREKQEASALVFFNNRVNAASAAQNPRMVDTLTVVNTFEFHQVIWSNLPKQL